MRMLVEGNVAPVVKHLVQNHHIPGCLQNLTIRVIAEPEHRETSRHTTLTGVQIYRRVVRPDTQRSADLSPRPRRPGDFPMWRVHNQRRAKTSGTTVIPLSNQTWL